MAPFAVRRVHCQNVPQKNSTAGARAPQRDGYSCTCTFNFLQQIVASVSSSIYNTINSLTKFSNPNSTILERVIVRDFGTGFSLVRYWI